MQNKLFGQVLLNLSLISEPQLKSVLELQEKGSDKLLGQLLVSQGLIDEKTLRTVLTLQARGQKKQEQATTQGVLSATLSKEMESASIDEFLQLAIEFKATELHLGCGEKPTLRLNGMLVELPLDELEGKRTEELIFSVLMPDQIEELNRCHYVELCMQRQNVGRFRMSVYRHRRGLAANFAVVAEDIWPFEQLNLPRVMQELAAKNNGLVLVTGPAGSGKSTTLASIVDFINRNYRRHIITIEDPIEVIHRSRKSMISQREVNTHTLSYAAALKAALREDPDVLVVGELRDPETVSIAITAAETGHLVFGTLHTRNSYGTIVRLLDQFPPKKRAHVRTVLAGVLRGIFSQQLVPNQDGDGRSLAYEMLVVNAAIAKLIIKDRVHQIPSIMQTGKALGMCLLDDSLIQLVEKGKVSLEEALFLATEKEKFNHLTGRRGGRLQKSW